MIQGLSVRGTVSAKQLHGLDLEKEEGEGEGEVEDVVLGDHKTGVDMDYI